MYATMHGSGAEAAPGPVEQLRLRQVAGPRELVVRLHPGQATGPDAYVVETDAKLAAAGEQARIASVLTFSGPLSDAVKAAGDRAHRDRISPAMVGRPGGVRVLRLWQPERRRQVIVVLATDQDTLTESQQMIATMPLLPGEDPALLPGPDHVELFEVQS